MIESGLPEVAGFALILGLIAAAFSICLAYAVPAQGRENEILHMNEVSDEFASYNSFWTACGPIMKWEQR
jgi:hypothetical protein